MRERFGNYLIFNADKSQIQYTTTEIIVPTIVMARNNPIGNRCGATTVGWLTSGIRVYDVEQVGHTTCSNTILPG